MKGQQNASGGEEGTLHLQEGGVPQEEDQDPPSITSVQSPGSFTTDPAVRYIFRTDNSGGQVTYRVIQVTDAPLDVQNEGTAAVSVLTTAPGFSPTSQAMTQSVLQGSFINGENTEIESSGSETRFAYLPTADSSATAVVTSQGSDAILSQAASAAAGQFYVMMSPQDVLPGSTTQRSITPRAHPYSPKLESPRVARDDKRRAQHNE
ncbi:upstream stimulatory factor 1-like, partial [Mustelus asterias]